MSTTVHMTPFEVEQVSKVLQVKKYFRCMPCIWTLSWLYILQYSDLFRQYLAWIDESIGLRTEWLMNPLVDGQVPTRCKI